MRKCEEVHFQFRAIQESDVPSVDNGVSSVNNQVMGHLDHQNPPALLIVPHGGDICPVVTGSREELLYLGIWNWLALAS